LGISHYPVFNFVNAIMKILFYILLGSFLLSWNAAQAQLKPNHYTYQAAQVQFWYPSEWEVSEAERVVTAQTIDGALSMTFSIMQADQIEEALMELESIIQTRVTLPQITAEPELVELKGMQGVMTEVEGTMEGKEVQLGVFIIDSPQNVLLVLGVGQKEALKKYNQDLNKVIQSIEPI